VISNTVNSINFVFNCATQKKSLFFWLFIRLISAILPLITIYQFSNIIKLIETNSPIELILSHLLLIFFIRISDNFLRLKSITKLEHLISNLSFDIHNYFLLNFHPDSKLERHSSIQAIRNFADATIKTLTLFVQPGIDSIVSVIFIPTALFFIDFKAFVITISYISIYFLINHFSNQRYKELRDFQNTKTEAYYAKFQETNDIDLEQSTFTRHHKRLTNWNFTEWFSLQNTAVFFYSLILLYQIIEISRGESHLSGLVLVIGYCDQTQVFLNSFTDIFHSLGDMYIALKHLATNQSISVITIEDLT
jgi:ABC-type multidrug transport system fused ATPase/permease subunit